MNQKQFLRRLKSLLRDLPDGERERILEHYRGLLEDKIRGGLSEEAAVGGLGDVRSLAERILSEHPERRRNPAGRTALIAVLSVLGVALAAGLTVMILGLFSFRQSTAAASAASSAAGIFPGPGASSGREGEDRHYAVKAEGVDAIRVVAQNKEVRFVAEDTDSITADYRDEEGQKYEFSLEGGVFTLDSQDNRKGGRFPGFTLADAKDRITLHVPADYSGEVIVKADNSAISAAGFQKMRSFRCETSNAAIRMSDFSAQLVAFDTSNAGISLANVAALDSISATTRNAAISIERLSSPFISLSSENALIRGAILGNEEDYTIRAETSNGACNLKDRTGGDKKLFVKTSNALIDLRFE